MTGFTLKLSFLLYIIHIPLSQTYRSNVLYGYSCVRIYWTILLSIYGSVRTPAGTKWPTHSGSHLAKDYFYKSERQQQQGARSPRETLTPRSLMGKRREQTAKVRKGAAGSILLDGTVAFSWGNITNPWKPSEEWVWGIPYILDCKMHLGFRGGKQKKKFLKQKYGKIFNNK